MLSLHDLPTITETDVLHVDFFADFIVYLERVQKIPVKLTKTGNISLGNITEILTELKTLQPWLSELKQVGKKRFTEDDLLVLTQIKTVADVMGLTYNRKGEIRLSKKGNLYLKNKPRVDQYEQMVLHFWYRVNWEYFSFTTTINKVSLAELLQQKQDYFWRYFLQTENKWIDYLQFCRLSSDYFQLHNYFTDPANHGSDYFQFIDVEFSLFTHNLVLLGCVETEISEVNTWEKRIVKFHPTKRGLHMFYKALYDNYL